MSHPLEKFWSLLLDDDSKKAATLLTDGAAWDDPLFDRADGAEVAGMALPRLADWFQKRAASKVVRHLRTTADDKRVAVENVLWMRDGLIWNQATQRSEKIERFELATAVVGDRAPGKTGLFRAIRIYFGTWALLDGVSRMRKGPICPDERQAAKAALDAMPTIRGYFDAATVGDPKIAEFFEPDGYFREPANNFACGRDQLAMHFEHILKLGGVGIDFLTATRQDQRLALELQTVKWGPKSMPVPQAGFASYDLGEHGKLQGARVYDSVVPPEL